MSGQRFAVEFFSRNFDKFLLRYESGDYDIVQHWLVDGSLQDERRNDPFALQYSDSEIVQLLSSAYYKGMIELLEANSKIQQELLSEILKIEIKYAGNPIETFEELHRLSGDMVRSYKVKEFEKKLKTADFSLTQHLEDKEETEILYTYSRRLRGGIVTDFRGGVQISHIVARTKDFRHGDKLRFINETTHRDGKTYNFEVVERVDLPQKDRVELSICEVKSDSLGSYIDTYYDKELCQDMPIIIGDTQQKIYLNDDDIKLYSIEDGMYIDAAYWENKPNNVKIVWRHTSETNDVTPKLPSFYKKGKVKAEDDNIPLSSIECSILKDKKICVVGFDPRDAVLNDAIRRIGGKYISISGDGEQKSTVMRKIKDADCIVTNYSYSNHTFIKQMNFYAKEAGVSIRNIPSFGITSILRAAIAALMGTRVGQELVLEDVKN